MEVTAIGKFLYEALDKFIEGQEGLKKFLPISFLAKESMLIIGPTGTAKTLSSELIAHATDLHLHHVQGTNEMTINQIIGPAVLIREKTDLGHGKEEEKIFEGFEPGCFLRCDTGFFDEITRAPDEIMNVLLPILNEGRYEYFNPSTKKEEWTHSSMRQLIAAANPKSRSSKLLEEQVVDRFSLGVICRNLIFKKRFKNLREAMRRSRTWPENLLEAPISKEMKGRVSKSDLDKAYECVGGSDPRIKIPLIVTWALVSLLDIIIETRNLQEDDAVFTDRAAIAKLHKLLRAHALFEGRLKVSWDDFRVFYGYITHRVEKIHRKPINHLVELFIDTLKHHVYTKEIAQTLDELDKLKETIDHSLAEEKQREENLTHAQALETKAEAFFEEIKSFFITAKDALAQINTYEELRDATSEKPFEGSFKDVPSPDKKESAPPADQLKNQEPKKEDQNPAPKDKEPQGHREQGAKDKKMTFNDFFLDQQEPTIELSTSQTHEAGPETDIDLRGIKNFETAESVNIFLVEIGRLKESFRVQRKKEHPRRGEISHRKPIKNLEDIKKAEPSRIPEYIDSGAPKPLIKIRTVPDICLFTARDVSYSMAGEVAGKGTLATKGNLARWASQIDIAICHEGQQRDFSYAHMDFSERQYFSTEQRIALAEQMRLISPDISKIEKLIHSTDCKGATDIEFMIETALSHIEERTKRYGEMLTFLVPITDGIETIRHGKLDALLAACVKKSIVITPVFIFDPLGIKGQEYIVYKNGRMTDLKAPSTISHMAEETEGMIFWGIQDSEHDRVAFATKDTALRIIRALAHTSKIEAPRFSSTGKNYRSFGNNMSTDGEKQKTPFNTENLYKTGT
ncbi:MAG: MoxR family ATPase [bacterium]|nr:MoxR family ATPase [bacterium]